MEKGQYGGSCNITSCQKLNSATWFNHFNQKYYCETCANRLNNDEFNRVDAQRILGHLMCTQVVENNIEVKNFMREAITYPVAVVGHGKSNLDYALYKASLDESPIIVAQEEKERGITINNAFKNLDTGEITKEIPYNQMFTMTKQDFDGDFKTGKEKRRERRAKERNNKKL
jgi:hypothetical protein